MPVVHRTSSSAPAATLHLPDGRALRVPTGWPPPDVDRLGRVRAAVQARLRHPPYRLIALPRLLDLLFPTRPEIIEPGDFWAASAHGANSDPATAAALLLPSTVRALTRRHLRTLTNQPPLSDATPQTFDAMWDLHQTLRRVESQTRRNLDEKAGGPQLVEILCALKCPTHFPLPTPAAPWGNTAALTSPVTLFDFAHRTYGVAAVLTDPAVQQLIRDVRQQGGGDGRAAAETAGAAVASATDLRLISALLCRSQRTPATRTATAPDPQLEHPWS